MSTVTEPSAAHDFEAPVAVTADGPRLVAGRCSHCESVAFPRRASCNACGGGDVERHLLPATGTLWSFTVQGFAPKSPPFVGAFEPFGVGYVEFA
ncbi:MAG TPA: zinc ribbon domain-containing protein, partial [Solirubrobacteraceae bacterium]